jgi:hypothetical protein
MVKNGVFGVFLRNLLKISKNEVFQGGFGYMRIHRKKGKKWKMWPKCMKSLNIPQKRGV